MFIKRHAFWVFIIICTNLMNIIQANKGVRRVVCYYTTWARYYISPMNYLPENIPPKLCDTLVYVSVKMNNSTYDIEVRDHYGDIELGGIKSFTNLKSPGTEILFAIGAFSDKIQDFTIMAADSENRKQFVSNVLKFADKNAFDGMVFNWEGPGDIERGGSTTDKENYVLLLKDLKNAFSPKKLKLVIMGPNNVGSIHEGYNVKEIAKIVDEIHVKSYDMHGYWVNTSDSQSPLFSRKSSNAQKLHAESVSSLMAIWASKGASRDKLFVGIRVLGTTSKLNSSQNHALGSFTVGPGQAEHYSRHNGEATYYEICFNLMNGDWKKDTDLFGHVPYAYNGSDFVTYEDPQSAADKARLVKYANYGGIFLYGIAFDDFRGLCGEKHAILRSVRREIDSP